MPYQNNPYFLPGQEDQQIAGLSPIMQNIAAQQANQNAAMAQMNQISQQAGKSNGAGVGNLALAMALRKDKKPGLGETTNDAGKVIADPTYGNGGKYGQMTKDELENMKVDGL